MVRNSHNAEDRHQSTHYHRPQSRSIDDELIADSYRAISQRRPAHQQQSRGRQRRDISDGMKQCPICGISIAGWQSTRQQSHLESCFNSTVSPQTSYVIMSYDKRPDTEECGICLEDFKVGDSIALLSCLCKYHLQCIRLWFAKVSSVKCPLHDSTSLHRN
ncbi:hypothetical protein MP228_006955 [Amoeboaphelidium protococcarum]|nr:hypothetical protein MP228_006955 [Amoeboaphelidium protococcarum]